MAHQHERVWREMDLAGEKRLAEVLVRGVVDPGHRVEAEAVLGLAIEGRSVRTREAVAVPEIHHDRCALQRSLDRRPGRVRRGDRDDVRRPACRLARSRSANGPVIIGQVADGPDDDDHTWCPLEGGDRRHGHRHRRCRDHRDGGEATDMGNGAIRPHLFSLGCRGPKEAPDEMVSGSYCGPVTTELRAPMGTGSQGEPSGDDLRRDIAPRPSGECQFGAEEHRESPFGAVGSVECSPHVEGASMTGVMQPPRPAWVPKERYPFVDRYIEIDGNLVHYIDEGVGPLLLFLHGNPGWSFSYRGVITRLTDRFRCVAIDYPGFGLSTAAAGYDFRPYSHARLVETFIERLGPDGVMLFITH